MAMTDGAECVDCGRVYAHVHEPCKRQRCEKCGTLLYCGWDSCTQPKRMSAQWTLSGGPTDDDAIDCFHPDW